MYVNPTQFLVPIVAIVVGVVPALYVRGRPRLLGLAALAYFVAIGAKVAVELLFPSLFDSPSVLTYLAFGALTFVFEVGFAYLFLLPIWNSERNPDLHAGWTYGVYLALYENAVLLGLLPILSLVAVSFSNVQLTAGDPYSANVLSLAAPYALERAVSLIGHATWGLIAYVAVWRRKAWNLLPLIPLCLIDSIAAWWDFTHALSYLALLGLLLVYTVGTAYLALRLVGLWPKAIGAIRRPSAAKALVRPPSPPGLVDRSGSAP